jgi:adenine-specific DNA-methyltransferase
VGDPDSGNLLVQGDNLEALKALLPYYAGQVKCIYIDPPYNTGNESWVYNDNVNSPEMREWLGKTVGSETEDLSRHDKWLSMMYPRLSLLHSFLSKDGIFLMSIDDNEAARAKMLLDEILGGNNFIAQLVWEKGRKNDAKLFSVGHEYILVYARDINQLANVRWRIQKEGVQEIAAEYHRLREVHGSDFDTISNELSAFYKRLPKGHPSKKYSRSRHADERGVWRDNQITWHGGGGPKYKLIHPVTGKPCKIPADGWRFVESTMMEKIRDGWIVFREDHTTSPILKQYTYMVEDFEDEDSEGNSEVLGSVFYRHSQPSNDVMKAIFGSKVFPNPKDHDVLTRIIGYVTSYDRNAIILDSFAGSGTTAHAVLNLNAKDNGKRRFVLIEMQEQIAHEITAERIKRVVNGFNDTEGLGGGFRYCELGATLFDPNRQIREEVKYNDLAQHVYFVETGQPLPQNAKKHFPLLGVSNGAAVYLLYNGILKDKSVNGGNVLTYDVLEGLPEHEGQKVIYGNGSRISKARLNDLGIVFKQIPYEIREI